MLENLATEILHEYCSVMIYSCDAYSDVWKPFFKLLFKYWDCPYKVYLACETKSPRIKGVTSLHSIGDTWTERMYDCLSKIPTDYVICMCEDMFVRREVKQDIIDNCIEWMEKDEKIANFNFEKDYQPTTFSHYSNFSRKPDDGYYSKSCQPTLWRKSLLLELLNCKKDPWEWELSSTPNTYDYYSWAGSPDDLVFEYGYHNNEWFGIQKGKWIKSDVVPLFEKEGIDIDFSIRGFYEG